MPTIETTTPPQERDDFERRLETHVEALSRFARKLTRRGDEADDLRQDAIARALQYRASYDSTRPLKSWLFRIAVRLWIDRRAPSQTTASEPRASVDPVHRLRVAEALAALSPIEREVLIRFHVERRDIREIAARLAMPENTVKSHLHRARRRLAEQLEDAL